MDVERLRAAGQSCVEIHHFGAHVTSWKNAAGREMIYTSPTAIYDGSKAIRGGIPVCFPQFAKKGPLRQHGFARNTKWTHDKAYAPSSDGAAARFVLTDSETTRASAWPHRFEVAIIVSLSSDGNSLGIEMQVKNTNANEQPFSFTMALHSYFACDPLSAVLLDYDGVKYEDSSDPDEPGKVKIQSGDITFGKEVDRVYLGTKDTLSLAGLTLTKENLPDAVVWNPHVEKAAALGDMPDDGWEKFICIEPARVAEPATVNPGDMWTCSLKLVSSS